MSTHIREGHEFRIEKGVGYLAWAIGALTAAFGFWVGLDWFWLVPMIGGIIGLVWNAYRYTQTDEWRRFG